MKKHVFPTELAYVVGLFVLSASVALMTKADFGVSMIVAPAYLFYLKLSPIFPFFTFGMAEYVLQAVLLILLIMVLRKFRGYFLFSFVTAVIYGFMLDLNMSWVTFLPSVGFMGRLVLFAAGVWIGSLGIALLFESYIAPEVYELIVKEGAEQWQLPIHRFKQGYDMVSLLLSVVLSFALFGWGRFEGVKLGTLVCALANGPAIHLCSKGLHKIWNFEDKLPLTRYFGK